eukprot:Rhum_TRINITY_DN16419_c0_g1::Rhum_TRINITY_DN16419_c0_g1_i1::g.163157::m.163157
MRTFSTPATGDLGRNYSATLSESCGLSSVSTTSSLGEHHQALPHLRKCDPLDHHYVALPRYPGAECFAVQHCEIVADADSPTLRVSVVRTSMYSDDESDDSDDAAAEVHELPLDGRVEVDGAADYPATLGCGCSLFCVTSSATMDEYWFAVDATAKSAWGDALYEAGESLYVAESMRSEAA